MKPRTTHYAPLAFLCLGTVLALAVARVGRPPPTTRMAAAARAFLSALTPELRAKAAFQFDSPQRQDWHFVPRTHPGLTLGEMSDAQRTAAHALLRSALSSRGYLKVTGILDLEAVLRELESSPERDASKCAVAVFGDPGGAGAWGWKIEGHHLCLNFSSATGELTATTPSFLGANPAEVRSGPRAGWRVLAAEEDLGRELVQSLDEAQRTAAVISQTAPGDIILGPGRNLDQAKPLGVTWATLTEPQRAVLWRLIREYAENLQEDLASAQLDRITGAGKEHICFAWAGALEAGKGHYYRIQGPTFIIEYDNTQNDANHVHTVWHDTERDFGRDLLAEHYRGGHPETSPK